MSYASIREAERLAEAGDAAAQNFVGAAYLAGIGTEPDPTRALHWFVAAAEQGHAPAQNDLGMLFAEGVIVPKNGEQAFFWFSVTRHA